MTRTCTWLLALASVLGIVAASRADLPGLAPLFLPQLFGQETPQSAPPAQAAPVPSPRLNFGFPVLNERNPDVPTTTAAQRKTEPAPQRTDSEDDDCLSDLFWDCVDALIDFAPEARMVLQQLRPATPYHLAAAAALEYLAAMDAAQRAAAPDVVQAVPATPAPMPPSGWRDFELLPYPREANTGSFTLGLGLSTGNGLVGSFSCTKKGFGCGTYPPSCDDVPEACDNVTRCQQVGTGALAAKACKCCEDCKDCKNCTCKPGVVLSKEPFCCDRVLVVGPHSGLPVTMPPLLPPHALMPIGFPLPPPPPPHALMPPSPLHELAELNLQRAMISAAIQQVEMELAQLEHQQRVVAHVQPVPAYTAPKAHIVTDHFEAFCDSMSCLGGDPHCLMLQGEVRLTCRKSGHAVRIEAPCVVLNLRDGTFHVESRVAPTPIAPAVHGAVRYEVPAYDPVVRYQVMPPTMMWRTGLHPEYAPVPVEPGFVPAMPLRTGSPWTAPACPVQCPVVPRTAPVPSRDLGDK